MTRPHTPLLAAVGPLASLLQALRDCGLRCTMRSGGWRTRTKVRRIRLQHPRQHQHRRAVQADALVRCGTRLTPGPTRWRPRAPQEQMQQPQMQWLLSPRLAQMPHSSLELQPPRIRIKIRTRIRHWAADWRWCSAFRCSALTGRARRSLALGGLQM